MIANEIMDRIGVLIKTFVVFGLVSCVTSLAIRLILKSSSVMILHCIILEDTFVRRTRARLNNRRFTYFQLAGVGA